MSGKAPGEASVLGPGATTLVVRDLRQGPEPDPREAMRPFSLGIRNQDSGTVSAATVSRVA